MQKSWPYGRQESLIADTLVIYRRTNVSCRMHSELKCPLCDGRMANRIGRIFHREPVQVAGVPLDLEDKVFSLLGCEVCDLKIKAPQIPESKLLECYARASANNWGEDPDPIKRHFDKILGLARQFSPGNKILDIGCFNGAMLQHFGPAWDRHGLEPSHAAAKLAATRGIKILGSTLNDAGAQSGQFDVVTAIDVIEHLITPREFFATVDRLLKPGGIMIAVTSDTSTWPWQLEGSRYWYCSLPEHVCFWSRASIGHVARVHGWQVCSYETLRHQVSGVSEITGEMIRAGAFIAAHRLRGLGIPAIKRKLNRSAPAWITAPDHMLCVLKKG